MIFLDTGFLVALELDDDEHNRDALKIYEDIVKNKYGNVYVSDYIFDEAVTLTLSRTRNLSYAVRLGIAIKSSYNVIKVNQALMDSAWEIFRTQKTAELSFTDCTNIAIMQDLRIKDIATFDGGFKSIKSINIVK